MTNQEYYHAWRMNIGPSINDLDRFNNSIALHSKSTNYIIFGNVFWDDDTGEYIFYFTKQITGPAFTNDYSQLVLSSNEYSNLKNDLQRLTGINTIKGIYNQVCPDKFYDSNVILLWEKVFNKELE